MNFYRSDLWVKLVSGQAVPGAQVYVLSQTNGPANVTPPITPPRTIPVPFVPNPQAQVYSDQGFTPIVQPIVSDGFGHADFYTLPGLYTVAIFSGGKLQQFYIDQTVGNSGSAGTSAVLLQTNGSPNFNQGVLNLTQGSNITLTPDNSGNVVIAATNSGTTIALKTNGTTNGSQTLLNLVNGANIAITQDGAGNTTVASSPTGFIPTPDVKMYSLWMPNGNATWYVTNDTVTSSNGGSTTAIIAASATGMPQEQSLTNGGNNISTQGYSGVQFIYAGRSCTLLSRAGGSGATTGYRLWEALEDTGLSVSGLAGSDNPTAANLLGFTYNSTISANWRCCTSNGVATTFVDSGIPISVGSCKALKIVYNGSSSATFFINGVLVATIATTLPTSTAVLRLVTTQAGNGVGGTNGGIVEYMYADSTSP